MFSPNGVDRLQVSLWVLAALSVAILFTLDVYIGIG